MHNNIIPNRHTAGASIQGEWSIKTTRRKISKSKLLLSALTFGGLLLAMSIGAAAGF